MDRALFANLIRSAIQEITSRYPRYFSHFDVCVPPLQRLTPRLLALPPFMELSSNELEVAVIDGARLLETLGIKVRPSGHADEISVILISSIIDAYAASQGRIDLMPLLLAEGPVKTSGVDYYPTQECAGLDVVEIKHGGGRPLVLITATGMPLTVWSNLLLDRTMRRHFIIVRSRAGPLLQGGTTNDCTLFQDVADIRRVLKAKRLEQVDVLGWCNGSKTAIELARGAPAQVASLTLLSPTFHGSVSSKEYPSHFEDLTPIIYDALKRDRSVGQWLLETLVQGTRLDNPELLPRDPEERCGAILRLPPHAITRDLMAPFSSVDNFLHFAYRFRSDDEYNVKAALSATACPLLVVMGSHDASVNNAATKHVLRLSGRSAALATLHGAGHHIHVLEYGYLRYAISLFLAHLPLESTSRLAVEHF